MKPRLGLALLFCLMAVTVSAQIKPAAIQFQVTSTAFKNNGTLPISTISNILVDGVNACSIDGSQGGNMSPELSWTNAPAGTRSFAVTTYDTTAAFTHWGIYNISGSATGLPENAGIAGSTFGTQVINDFFIGPEYDGPCPPPNLPPNVHHYVFTVYALDKTLTVPSSANFPANAESLYNSLIDAAAAGHVLGTARIVGLYSTTPTAK